MIDHQVIIISMFIRQANKTQFYKLCLCALPAKDDRGMKRRLQEIR